MRFSAESVVLGAALLALPAAAAPIKQTNAQASSQVTEQTEQTQGQTQTQGQGQGQGQPGFYDTPSQPGTKHLESYEQFEQTPQNAPSSGTHSAHFQAGYKAGQDHAKSITQGGKKEAKKPKGPNGHANAEETAETENTETTGNTGNTGSTGSTGANQPTVPSSVRVGRRMLKVRVAPEGLDARAVPKKSKTDAVVHAANSASQMGGALGDALQVGSSVVSGVKDIWHTITGSNDQQEPQPE